MNTRLSLAASSLLIVLSAAACGDSFDDTPPPQPAPGGSSSTALPVPTQDSGSPEPDADPVDPEPSVQTDAAPADPDAAPEAAPEPDAAPPEPDAALPEPDAAVVCDDGTDDCDHVASNGCETSLDAVSSCGACGNVCAPGAHGEPTCSQGMCGIACHDGFANCDADASNGCEVELGGVDACGACGIVCPSAPHGTPACEGGACGFLCNAGFDNCDGDMENGCEAALATTTHCGACGIECSAGHQATAVCTNGMCGYACNQGFADCDGIASNGCEASLDTTSHCGGCETSCYPRPHGSATCEQGACGVACEGAYANCNGALGDGCEVDTTTDTANCGGCGVVCPVAPHSPAWCDGGGCTMVCDIPWVNCNGVASDGCEVNITADTDHCGGCGRKCGDANATASCQNTQCALACASGFADCDGNNANGCEVNLSTNGDNCGACGYDCGAGACEAGRCQAWVVSTEALPPVDVAADETHVYWVTDEGVRRAATAGGAATTVKQSDNALSIAQSGNYLYWVTSSNGAAYRVSKTGGASLILATAQDDPRSIVADGAVAYWLNRAEIMTHTGSTAKALATTSPSLKEVAVDSTSVYYTVKLEGGSGGKVVKVSRTTGAQTVLYFATDDPLGIDLDGHYVYFVTYTTGALKRVAKAGGAATTLASGLLHPTGVVVDGDRVWVTESGGDTVKEVHLDGTPETERFNGGSWIARMAQSSTTVFWVDTSGMRVYAMKK